MVSSQGNQDRKVCFVLKHFGSYFVQILFVFLPCMWGGEVTCAFLNYHCMIDKVAVGGQV